MMTTRQSEFGAVALQCMTWRFAPPKKAAKLVSVSTSFVRWHCRRSRDAAVDKWSVRSAWPHSAIFEGQIFKLPFRVIPFNIQMSKFTKGEISRCSFRKYAFRTIRILVVLAELSHEMAPWTAHKLVLAPLQICITKCRYWWRYTDLQIVFKIYRFEATFYQIWLIALLLPASFQ